MAKFKKVEESEDNKDDFEDSEEEELEEEEMEQTPKKNVPQNKPVQKKASEEPIERYQHYYHPEIIGIIDTVSKELIIDGLPSISLAKLEAMKLNMLDRIGTVSGV